jgi:hypothetical protein
VLSSLCAGLLKHWISIVLITQLNQYLLTHLFLMLLVHNVLRLFVWLSTCMFIGFFSARRIAVCIASCIH